MIRKFTPATMTPPAANYSHVAEVPAGARTVFLAGQVGIAADGSIPEDAGEQSALAFDNVVAGLAACDMTMADAVRVSVYLTDLAHRGPYMAVRDRYVTDPPPASTLLIVAGLANPALKVEVEVIAAKVD